ncbi:reverse transcriptase [Phytophthora megakarya]|uniref:Reverse transcriptase n=1 Tax=Phytophthora megakarya TaxID=4795 RepID=A0A225V0C5_9STRA|nr:reverse transcriptase [Phytophthora megakarya]
MGRSQARKMIKRVHFEDDLEDSAVEAETEAEALTDNSRAEAQRTNTEAQHMPNADDIDPVTVQEERRRRISKAQDEEQRWSMLKAILRGETAKTSYKEARDAWKCDNLLYYVDPTRSKSEDDQPELLLKLVVPTTMIQEVLPNCHGSVEGGHQGVVRSYQRVKHDYYWIGLYVDVEKHVKSRLDCSSSKSAPQLKGYSPGNVLTE